MFSIKKWILVFFVSMCVLTCFQYHVSAEGISESVKDAYDSPEQSTDSKSDTKDSEEEEEESSTSTELSFSDFVKVIAAMLFVVILLYALLRYMNKRNRTYQKANLIENLGGTSLGTNRSVQLIKVGKSVLVVGVGENIQLLKEIANQEEYEQLLEQHNEKIDQQIIPRDIITKLKGKLLKKESSSIDFSSQLKKQLQDMTDSRRELMAEMDKRERDSE